MPYPPKLTAAQKASTPEASNHLSDARREKLISLQKKQKLHEMLVTKFKAKYARGTSNDAAASAVVTREVADFLRNGRVTEEELSQLEYRIREETHPVVLAAGASRIAPPGELKKGKDTSSASETAKNAAQAREQSAAASEPAAPSAAPKVIDDEWAAISQYNLALYQEEERKTRERLAEKKAKVKTELHKQIEMRNSKKGDFKKDDLVFAQAAWKDVEAWKVEEKSKADALKDRALKEKADRDVQLEQDSKRRAEEEKQRRHDEDALLKRMHDETEKEKKKAADKLVKSQQMLQEVLKENEAVKLRKLAIKEQEMQNDVKAAQDFVKMLDKQEADRNAAVQAREDLQKKLMNRMANTVVKAADNKAKEEELRLLNYQLERDMKMKELDDEKRRKLEKVRQDNKAYLTVQIQEKHKKKDVEVEERKQLAQVFKKEADDFVSFQREVKQNKKNSKLEFREELQKQMDERRRQAAIKMSDTEVKINADLLRNIQEKFGKSP